MKRYRDTNILDRKRRLVFNGPFVGKVAKGALHDLSTLFTRLSVLIMRQESLVVAGALVALILGTVSADAGRVLRANKMVISSDAGGRVFEYARDVSRARHSSTDVQIRGKCQSACTLYLSLPADQICIARGASFHFHRAFGSSAQSNEWGTQYLLKSYPVWVRQWIASQGGLSNRFIHMNYEYAARYVPTCNSGNSPTNMARRETAKPQYVTAAQRTNIVSRQMQRQYASATSNAGYVSRRATTQRTARSRTHGFPLDRPQR